MGSMILQNTGHTAIAKAIHDQNMYLAWGDIPPFLGAPTGVTSSASNTGGSLPAGSYIYVVTAYTPGGETQASSSTSANVTGANTGSITITWSPVAGAKGYKIYGRTTSGRYYIASTVSTTYTDVGTIAPNVNVIPPTTDTSSINTWTTNPPVPGTGFTGLYREIGRRKISLVQYVVPDVNGTYVTSAGRWSISLVPTNFVYCYVAFDLTDAATATIYQFGIFLGCTPAPGYTNYAYLLPSQISDPGSLLNIENVSPIFRNSSSSETHQVVLTF